MAGEGLSSTFLGQIEISYLKCKEYNYFLYVKKLKKLTIFRNMVRYNYW